MTAVAARRDERRTADPLPGPRDAFRWAIAHGMTDEQAGNFAAVVAGMPLDELHRAWSVRELEHLEFLRELVASGRLAGDTEAGR